LIVSRETARSRGAYIQGPIYSTQNGNGHVGSSQGSRISKSARGSVLSASASATLPVSPSVGSSNMLDRLQRRREEEHRQLPQQDPYDQYMSANQGYPQQHHQYTPHPSVPGSVKMSVTRFGEGVQPQLPHTARILTAQPPSMNVNPSREQHWGQQERQGLQQYDPRQGFPSLRSSAAETTSTRVSSDVLSYVTPPEARRPPLPSNSSQPQIQDYFNQPPAAGVLSQTQPSTEPANYTPSAQTALVRGFTKLPGYSNEKMKNNVQGNVASSSTLPQEYTPEVPSTNSAQTTLVRGLTKPPGYTTEKMKNNVEGNVTSTSTYPQEKLKS